MLTIWMSLTAELTTITTMQRDALFYKLRTLELTTLQCLNCAPQSPSSYMFLLAIFGPSPSSLPTIEISQHATPCSIIDASPTEIN